jgi:hypothetical protein
MKKATRLLTLTAFVLPLSLIGSAYANGPGPGQTPVYHNLGVHHVPAYTPSPNMDGFEPTGDPLHLQDPIGDPSRDAYRNDLYDRVPMGGRDPFRGSGTPGWEPRDPGATGNGNGGQTAPIDGGISLLVMAGIGLGIKKARSRKQSAQQPEEQTAPGAE